MAITYEPIATANGDGTATTITFSSIPNTYTDLRVIIQATSTGSGQYVSPAIRFNSDSAGNYNSTILWGDGASTGSYRANSSTSFYAGPTQAGIQHLYPGVGIVDIFSYAGSTFKTSLISGFVTSNAGAGSSEKLVTCWRNTNAITTVAVISQGSAFSTSTVITIYGIKAA